MMHFEKKLSSKEVFRGKIISVNHDIVELENGKEALREIVVHPGAVVILAVQNGYAYFVRQFRYCLGVELLEAPAGKLELGEEHRDAAVRELKEEVGAEAGTLKYLGLNYPSPGCYTEVFHMYFATDLVMGEQSPDEDEFLTVEKIKIEDFEDMIARGEVSDGKSIAIFAMAKAQGLI